MILSANWINTFPIVNMKYSLNSENIDYNGRRYRPPYQCFCCGAVISREQFAFSRTCPTCDIGGCTHPPFDPSSILSESIPSELVDLVEILMRKIGYETAQKAELLCPACGRAHTGNCLNL
jgi:hypothetical protein